MKAILIRKNIYQHLEFLMPKLQADIVAVSGPQFYHTKFGIKASGEVDSSIEPAVVLHMPQKAWLAYQKFS